MATTESGTVQAPGRTLDEIRADLMRLEREVSHHYLYALWQQDRERGAVIADAAVDMHHASLTLGAFVYPIWPR
jgi:hypothetical protein